MALVAIAKALAIFVGYKETKYNNNDPLQIEETTSSVSDLGTSLGNATSKAKELKKILMGFDVLNVIETPDTTSSGSSGGGGPTAIDPAILNALKEYDNLMSGVNMKAISIRDKIMEWLGFQKMVNEETGEITWKLKEGETNFKKIKDSLTALIAVILTIQVIKKLASIISFISSIVKGARQMHTILTGLGNIKALSGIAKSLSAIVSTAAIVVTAILALVYVFQDAYRNDEEFRKSVDELVLAFKELTSMLSPVLKIIKELAKLLMSNLYQSLKVVLSIIKELLKLNLKIIIDGLTSGIKILTSLIKGDFAGAFDIVKNAFGNLINNFANFGKNIISIFTNWGNTTMNTWENTWENITSEGESSTNKIVKFVSLASEEIESLGTSIQKSYKAQNDTLQNYKNTLDELSSSVSESSNKIKDMSTRYTLLGQTISSEDTKNILEYVSQLAKDSVDLVEKSTSQQISIISESFEKIGTLEEKSSKEILTNITKSGENKKKKVKEAEKNITTIFENASKEKRAITDEEYKTIAAQLEKIRKLTNTEMQLAAGEQLALKQQVNDKSLALDSESYKKIKEQLESSQSETLDLIKKNNDQKYAYALQASEDAYELALDEGKSIVEAEKIKNSTLKTLTSTYQEEYKKDQSKANQEYEALRQDFVNRLLKDWQTLEAKGSENLTSAERKNKEAYEQMLRDFGYTSSQLQNSAYSAGEKTAQSVSTGFYNNKPYLQMTLSIPNGYNAGANLAKSIAKGFDDYKENVKFAPKGTSQDGKTYFYGWSHSRYATGGFPDVGEMFLAREAGPELVGTIGSKTAVVNNQQIVEAVAKGVANAVSKVMASSQANRNYNFYMDGDNVTNAVTIRQRRMESVMGV